MADKPDNRHLKKLELRIEGMQCANCEELIELEFKKIAGVRRVKIRRASGKAEVMHSGGVDVGTLHGAIEEHGYAVSLWGEQNGGGRRSGNTRRDYLEIAAAFLILVGLFLGLRQLDLLPRGVAISENMSYAVVFLVGLVASVSTCIAVTGGLLVAVAAKYNEAHAQLSDLQRLKPHIYFNAGRIVSYTLLGGAVGALGSALTLSPEVNGLLMILASVVMIVLGLHMLRLFPSLGLFLPRMPKFLAKKIHDHAEKETKGGAFLLGASTFFLPCSFTQALQLYVLAKGSFVTGALTMLVFSLGTLPALLSLSAASSFARGAFQRYFLKLAGAAVIFLGVINIQYGFVLADAGLNAASIPSKAKLLDQPKQVSQTKEPEAPAETRKQDVPAEEKQVVNMKVVGLEYIPNRFIVTQGVPVEWRIDAQEAIGCGRILIVPRLRIRKLLYSFAANTITFTPEEPGEIVFNCGMGMMTPDSKFIVIYNAKG